MSDKILEVGAAGIEGMDEKVKVLMNNIVNSQTPGYKKSDVVIKSFPTYLDEAKTKSSTQIPQVTGVSYNQSPGTLVSTGNKTDIAIGGPGFFEVETPNGIAYTRDGRFVFDKDGKLVTVAGNYPVIGRGGQVSMTPGSNVDFTADGKVIVDGIEVNALQVVTFDDQSALKPISGALFKADSDAQIQANPNPRVVSGYVETSNVNDIEEMMNLIYYSHIYNVDTKVVSNREAMLAKAVTMGNPPQ